MKSIKTLLIAALSIVSISVHAQTSPKPKATVVYYTCPMHTDYRSDKPGKCPKCGMTLVKKEENAKDSTADKKAPMKMKM
jgi:Heavy metal binding domain